MRSSSRALTLTAPDSLRWNTVGILLAALTYGWAAMAQASPTGHIVIAGHGPELPVLQDLARAFEKQTPGTAVDFNWDKSVRAIELVRRGGAHIAVTDQPDATLKHTQIAWDGIAVVVNFSNPIKDVSLSQVRALLTGQITRWSALDGADVRVTVYPRAPQANLSTGLEIALGIPGKLAGNAPPLRQDQQALSAVSGHNTAVTYLSLHAALKAQDDGIPIRVLTVDQVEAGEPTVRNGRYRLRRPVLLLTTAQPDPVTTAFLAFTLSPEGQRIVRTMFILSDRPVPSAHVLRSDRLPSAS